MWITRFPLGLIEQSGRVNFRLVHSGGRCAVVAE